MPTSISSMLELLPAHYQVLFNRNPHALLIVACESHQILAANGAAEQLFDHEAGYVRGFNLKALFHPDDWPPIQQALQTGYKERGEKGYGRQRIARSEARQVEWEATHIDLESVQVCLMEVREVNSATPRASEHAPALVQRNGGEDEFFQVDVSQNHNELIRFRQELGRLNAIVNTSHDAIISTNSEGLIQTFSPGAEKIFGIQSEDILGLSVDVLLPERFRAAHIGFRQEFALHPCSNGRTMGLRRVKGLRADGVEIELEGSIANVLIDDQKVLITTLRDVSHRLAIEAEQELMRRRLSQLTDRLRDQERALIKRISRALHDQLGQTLAAVRLVHETITLQQAQDNRAELFRLHARLETLIERAIREVRVVFADLQPPMLEEDGLATALDNELLSRAQSHNALQLVFEASPEVASIRWPVVVEYAVFMIAREAIENATRHSGATLLQISLAGGPSDLTLKVWDNGCGYTAEAKGSTGHLGLDGITARATSIGAKLSLNFGEMGGAHLILHWVAPP